MKMKVTMIQYDKEEQQRGREQTRTKKIQKDRTTETGRKGASLHTL